MEGSTRNHHKNVGDDTQGLNQSTQTGHQYNGPLNAE